ncbi:MAG TPA: anhydro-N-acetylmuramic acid kinase [Candidatus Limnocylindria bacterium]|nr:anhydro-N-acetylmuramic acid kinase [Candidatus Limnocylindria bacterium]
MIAIGIMSGTSLDGIDLAAIEIDDAARPHVRLLASMHQDYEAELRAIALRAASGESDTYELAELHGRLGDAYADAASAFIETLDARPDVIALHGQTVAHLPPRFTLQLGDASRVAVRTGIVTISDFRSADMAAGGEGAPLVPFADHVLFADRAPIALLNLGGIANLTLIPTPRADDVVAFDTGPANIVSDQIALRGRKRFDEGGAGAARGSVREDALRWALAHPYFARRAPKSTGREEFDGKFADELFERAGRSVDDALATSVALSARTVADGLARETPLGVRWRDLVVGGGGARNPTLLARLREAVAPLPVRTIDELGIPASSREAVAFAILGAYRLRGLPNTLPSATGARRAVSGGAIHKP